MKTVYKTIIPLLILIMFSCTKQDEWLDAKRNKNDVNPETIKDFQAVLDNNSVVNSRFISIGLVGTDNISIADEDLPLVDEAVRNAYLWKKDIWPPNSGNDWKIYDIVALANVVLDGLQKADPSEPGYDNVKGQALFIRAYAYYYLSQTFCKPYDAATATGDLGLPIRTTSDANKIFPRSNLKDLYDFMIADTKSAIALLADNQALNYRANKSAALGFLAKLYLLTGDYTNALLYANESIKAGGKLIDFNDSNSVSLQREYRFADNGLQNPEILFYAVVGGYTVAYAGPFSQHVIPGELYNMYGENDLRKKYFFAEDKGVIKFWGTYSGSYYRFAGIALNELYLISAECEARVGSYQNAMTTLNKLLEKRFLAGSFIPLTAGTAEDALRVILDERRKELPFTGIIRWEDLRRLNKDPRFAKTLHHTVAEKEYILPPNDLNYTLPIAAEEIQLTNIEQNERH